MKKGKTSNVQRPTSNAQLGKEPDWKAIALELSQKLIFALRYLKLQGPGLVMIMDPKANSLVTRHWIEDFSDAVELIPGVKVDREAVYATKLPKKERDKFFADRKRLASEPSAKSAKSAVKKSGRPA